MGKAHAYALSIVLLLVAAGWFLAGRALDPGPSSTAGAVQDAAARSGVEAGPVAPVPDDRTPPEEAVVRDDVVFTPEDRRIFRQVVADARESRLDTLPLGEIIVRVGRRFVGEPYTPHTLDPPGPERLIINLREFDCVTYVESVLALARVIRDGHADFGTFTEEVRRIRYRDGRMDGYLSRLHYFSEWIADNEELGLVRDISRDLGGRPDDEAIDFMSTHAEAYAPLDGRPERVERIREVEARLSSRPRYYLPQDEVAGAVDGIQNGDIIAATSSVEGLDIAHTGFALWKDGRLHLMHAPLVGRMLEISEKPLATRILGIDGQDGVSVARPL